MKRNLDSEQLEIAKGIIANRLEQFPGNLVQSLLVLTEPLIRNGDSVSRKFAEADIEYLIQQHEQPELMAQVAAQFLHIASEIREVLNGVRSDEAHQPCTVHGLHELNKHGLPQQTQGDSRETH